MSKELHTPEERPVRVRFAPSPTGPLHVGGVRTALFNYLFARHHKGTFILRIEDTDSQRFVEGAEAYIEESLAWCGLSVDEGVQAGGEYGPYKQSERRNLYWKEVQRLLVLGWAYLAFDTPDELDAMRKQAEQQKTGFAYGPLTRMQMKNSLTLSAEEVQELSKREDWVVRFKIPADRQIVMNDLVRGQVIVDSNTLDDKVLYKRTDQLPTYHLANVVDDYHMKISHVIRGEEWLPSLPLHYLLYEAFGWEEERPQFAHLPLILKPSGNGKLSKRDGDKMGFPVFPLEWTTATGERYMGYRESGYLPEAFLNMLALLGWHPEGEQEIMSMEALCEAFSLERVSKAGARFDPEKAQWFNHQYMLSAPVEELAAYLRTRVAEQAGYTPTAEQLSTAIELVRERINLLPDLWHETDYLWCAPQEYNAKVVKKHLVEQSIEALRIVEEELMQRQTIDATFNEWLQETITEKGWPRGKVMNSLRLALVGESRGVDLIAIITFLGAKESVERIHRLVEKAPSLR